MLHIIGISVATWITGECLQSDLNSIKLTVLSNALFWNIWSLNSTVTSIFIIHMLSATIKNMTKILVYPDLENILVLYFHIYLHVYPITNGVAPMPATNICLNGILVDPYYIVLIILNAMLYLIVKFWVNKWISEFWVLSLEDLFSKRNL